MTDFGAQCGAYEEILKTEVKDFGATAFEEPSVAVQNHSDPGPHPRRRVFSGQWNVNNIPGTAFKT